MYKATVITVQGQPFISPYMQITRALVILFALFIILKSASKESVDGGGPDQSA